MTPAVIVVAGWLGQVLFFSRALVQWWQSERAGKSVAPSSYWWMSLTGTLLVGLYATVRGESFLLTIFAINSGVYLRNLLLSYPKTRELRLPVPLAAATGLAAGFTLMASGAFEPRPLPGSARTAPLWYAIGATGTALWGSRFLLQWWLSERAGRSQFPPAFWWFSLFGNGLLLAYAFRLGDPLFIAGFAIGPVAQVRNLVLHARAKGPSPKAPAQDRSPAQDRGARHLAQR